MKTLKSIKGVTLVELMITMVILGVLSMIAVPAYTGARGKALRSEVRSNLESIGFQQEKLSYDKCATAKGTDDIRATFSSLRAIIPPKSLYDYHTESGPAVWDWIAYAVPFDDKDGQLLTYCIDSERNKRACRNWMVDGLSDCSECSNTW